MNYYNDNDPFCCEWARGLLKAGLVPDGFIDSRSITEVKPEDLKGYNQWHLFSGILGWPYALKLANWPEDREVMTLSCPCQPFSTAGKRKGFSDERHLWPVAFGLIRAVRPVTIFGEQVASAKEWLDHVFNDLEGIGYKCGSVDLPACSVGAPHIRQRIWFVADTKGDGRGILNPANERPTDGEKHPSSNPGSR